MVARDYELLAECRTPKTIPELRHVIESEKALYRRVGILVSEKELHVVGYLKRENGRSLNLYCTKKTGYAVHDYMLGKVLGSLKGDWKTEDCDCQADAQLGRACLEMDCETEGTRQIIGRLKVYVPTNLFVVFIAPTQGRVDHILKSAHFLGDALIGCTFEEALTEDPTVKDRYGEKYALKSLLKNMLKVQQEETLEGLF